MKTIANIFYLFVLFMVFSAQSQNSFPTTGNVSIGSNLNVTGSISTSDIASNGWFRTNGIGGWYSNNFNIGINAVDYDWVRACDGGGQNTKGFASYMLFVQNAGHIGGNLDVGGTIVTPSWFRSTGNTGWYSNNYNVGIFAQDYYWVRACDGGGNTNRGFAAEQLYSSSNTTVGGNLTVYGTILATRVKVADVYGGNWSWSDYVFANDYKLKPLHEVEAYINTNKHLEGIPTTEEVKKDGIDIAPVTAKLLEKIEELTLYMIDLNKKVDDLEKENKLLNNK